MSKCIDAYGFLCFFMSIPQLIELTKAGWTKQETGNKIDNCSDDLKALGSANRRQKLQEKERAKLKYS